MDLIGTPWYTSGGLVTTGISRVRTATDHLRLWSVVGGVMWKWAPWCHIGALSLWVGGVVVMSVGPCDHVVAAGVW